MNQGSVESVTFLNGRERSADHRRLKDDGRQREARSTAG